MGVPLGVGLIGIGMMAAEHIMNLKLFGDVAITALSDPRPEQIDWGLAVLEPERAGKVKRYASHRDLIADPHVDVIVIASPNFTHAAILEDALLSGKAILCEKPMTTTLGDGVRILSRARASKGLFWIGMEYRYMPPVRAFIARVHAGETGTPVMLAIREHRFPFLNKVGDWNRFSANTGGTMVEKCCHFFDLMRHILKAEPVKVFCSGAMDVNHRDERYEGRVPDIIDNAYTIVDFDNGARAMLDLCMFADGSEAQEEIAVTGATAKLEVFIPSGEIVLSPRTGFGKPKQVSRARIAVDEKALHAGSHHGAPYYQWKAFFSALARGGPADVSADDGYKAVAMGVAAERSAREGRAVEMHELQEGARI